MPKNLLYVLERYNRVADRLRPNRTHFFESPTGQHYSCVGVSYNFSVLWEKTNGKKGNTVAYNLRHDNITVNINGWKHDAFGFNDCLHYLARSMGHCYTESTLFYYSVVPRLADMLRTAYPLPRAVEHIRIYLKAFHEPAPDLEVYLFYSPCRWKICKTDGACA